MLPLGFSWGAFFVYVVALVFVTLGGFWGLIASGGHPAFLVPILIGLFYFYLCWEAVVEDDEAPPRPPARKNEG